MLFGNELNPVCKSCKHLYLVEYSMHQYYCNKCYKEILKNQDDERDKDRL